ncbi:hypothetical protein F5Y16DRAFT_363187 [Xylariaceae sp. FL0255]|nr:hypothetical protein F5Y16DRAFT_363187 [Xylariaceae sp. FL0255]
MVSTSVSPPFHSSPSHSPLSSLAPSKKTMSITQTYYLAHKARAKLSNEAARPDHNLRLLVGHANLLDSLMLDLADAEREQESWFNQSVRGATPKTQEKHIQWADSVAEEDEDWEADSSDSDNDSDMDEDEDIEMVDAVPLARTPSYMITPPSPRLHTMDEDDDEFEDDEEDFTSLSLTRSPSHSASPPELEHDSESSEDEAMPPSPPTATMPTFSEKHGESTITAKYLQDEEEEDMSDFYKDGFRIPTRNPNRLISAISVY